MQLFLGIPFLATRAALIDVKKGKLTLRVGTEEVHFNFAHFETTRNKKFS